LQYTLVSFMVGKCITYSMNSKHRLVLTQSLKYGLGGSHDSSRQVRFVGLVVLSVGPVNVPIRSIS
jgi:hypothetical protein